MYTLYIDESGDAGLNQIRGNGRDGATPYMTLGAVLVHQDNHVNLEARLNEITATLNRDEIHCNRLNHAQKVFVAREFAKEEVTCFGLISYKDTLGGYADYIERDVRRYYNKCAGYLLERVGAYMSEKEIPSDQLNVCFEEGPFDYEAMANYIRVCQGNPIHGNARLLRNLQADRIVARPKEDRPLLQLADFVAHALFKCVDKTDTNFQIPEPRYLDEIHKRFYFHPQTRLIVGTGIKCVQNLAQLRLDPDVREKIAEFRG